MPPAEPDELPVVDPVEEPDDVDVSVEGGVSSPVLGSIIHRTMKNNSGLAASG